MTAPPVRSDAVLSEDGTYRYSLRRWWAPTPLVRFIMLNPSTADATVDDPTIRRCMGFARAWGYGGIVVHNLYALRATDPGALLAHPDPIGPDNDEHLRRGASAALTVCAWGAHPMAGRRADEVIGLLLGLGDAPHHLGLTKAGAPRHPLYLPRTAVPTRLVPSCAPATAREG